MVMAVLFQERTSALPATNEESTREQLIDPALQRGGWDVNNANQVGIEIPVHGFDPRAWDILKNKLRTLQTVFIQKRQLQLSDLYDMPFTHFGKDAVDWWFTLA